MRNFLSSVPVFGNPTTQEVEYFQVGEPSYGWSNQCQAAYDDLAEWEPKTADTWVIHYPTVEQVVYASFANLKTDISHDFSDLKETVLYKLDEIIKDLF